MRGLFSSANRWREGISDAFTRFPYAILCGAIGSGCAIVGIHESENSAVAGQCARLAMTVALGLPLFFSLRIIRERDSRFARWPIELIGVALLAAWFCTHSPRPFDEPEIVFVRWLLVLAALHFLAAISPYLHSADGAGFWQFNRRLFLRFCLATLYTGVLTAGFELALLSADKLFELHFQKAFAYLFFLMLGCFHPAFFLAGVPRDVAQLAADSEHPHGLKAFTQFALAPLVLVYGLILYAYALKIIFLCAWPHGWVALPVLILSGIGIFASLLLHPLRDEANEKWASWFGRLFPPALGPLAVLLLLSLRVRISDYGVTEERYLGVVVGFWILAWSIVFTIRRNAGIRWIPLSLALICLIAAFGPISAGAVSRRSQTHEIVTFLQEHQLWRDGHAIAASQPLVLSEKEDLQLQSTVRYLVQMHGADAVEPIFGTLVPRERLTNLSPWQKSREILTALQVVTQNQEPERRYYRNQQQPLDVTGFRRFYAMQNINAPNSLSASSDAEKIVVGLYDGTLKMSLGDAPGEPIPLDHLLRHLNEKPPNETPDDLMAMDFSQNGRAFRIIFNEVRTRSRGNNPRISGFDFYLLER